MKYIKSEQEIEYDQIVHRMTLTFHEALKSFIIQNDFESEEYTLIRDSFLQSIKYFERMHEYYRSKENGMD